jgi:hypothetical protein
MPENKEMSWLWYWFIKLNLIFKNLNKNVLGNFWKNEKCKIFSKI